MSDKSDGITLSPKYGLNATMDCCFWCGETKGVALLGKLKGDAKAPPYVITGYDPCDKCKEIFDKGILIMGVSEKQRIDGMPSIGEKPDGTPVYPDGSHLVVREEYVYQLYDGNQEAINRVLETRGLLMESTLLHKIIEYNQQEENKDESSECGVSDSDAPEPDETH